MTEAIRLSKRVAELRGCSRREAELLIQGGWVRVAGVVVEEPQHRVAAERIEVSEDARPMALASVTLLLHKPAGLSLEAAHGLLTPEHWAGDASGQRPLRLHFKDQVRVSDMGPLASGLLVFTQDERIARKLREDALLLEHEVLVDVGGTPAPEALSRLQQAAASLEVDGRRLGTCKMSWQSEARLRFALKGDRPGQLAALCQAAGLQVQGMRRLRIGRVALGPLAPGQWRYLLPGERF